MAGAGKNDDGAARPWGRFKLVSKEPADESDHLYFYRREHRIGRVATRADIVLDMQFISQIHCVISRTEVNGEQVVTLQDLSRNGVYVNETRVGKSNSIVLEPNITVHMTKPGLRTRDISPTVYKFELLSNETATAALARGASNRTERAPAVVIPPTQEVAQSVGVKRSSQEAELDATQPLSDAAARQRHGSATVTTVASPVSSRSSSRPTQDAAARGNTAAHIKIEAEAPAEDGSSKRRRTVAAASTVANSNDNTDADALAATARVQQSNRELRESLQQCQRSKAQLRTQLQETQSCEMQLRKQLHSAESEILALTTQLDDTQSQSQQRALELTRVRDELATRTATVEQLQDAQRKLEQALAESTQALAGANQTIADTRALNESLRRELELAAAQRNANGQSLPEMNAQVRALELEARELGLAVRTSDAETALSTVDVRGRGDSETMLAAALEVFSQIHEQKQKRIAHADDSFILDEVHLTPDSNLQLSGERSEPTPLFSSDVSTHGPEDGEDDTDRKRRAARSPPSSLSQVSSGSAPPSSSQSSGASQPNAQRTDDGDGSEEQLLPPVDRMRGESEDSALSGHSSSKTPPAKPIRVASTPNMQVAPVSATVAAVTVEEAVDNVDDVDASGNADEAVGDSDDDKERPQDAEAADDAGEQVADEEVATAAVADDADASSDASAAKSAELPSTETAETVAIAEMAEEDAKTHEVQSEGDAAIEEADEVDEPECSGSEEQGDAEAIDGDNADQRTEEAASVAQESAAAMAEATATATAIDVDATADADADAPVQPSRPERWLSPIADEESPDSEPNGAIFDDETQLSQ